MIYLFQKRFLNFDFFSSAPENKQILQLSCLTFFSIRLKIYQLYYQLILFFVIK